MKSLLDIQKEIRTLEQTVAGVSAALREVNDEIEMLCNTDDKPVIDFEQIINLSKQLPFAKHPISRWDDVYACRCYIEVLLCMVLLDDGEEERLNRLIFIQWLLTESSIEYTLEQLFTECYQLNKDSYAEKIESIPEEYREFLVADALMIAYLNGEANEYTCEYIVDLCEVFEINKSMLVLLYKTALLTLTQQMDCLPAEQKKLKIMSLFMQYYDESIRKKLVETLRMVVVEIPRHQARYFEWKLDSQGQYVQKGTVVAEMEDYYTRQRKRLSAPMNGACFCFQQNNVFYAVISHETDQLNDVQAWMMKRNKK